MIQATIIFGENTEQTEQRQLETVPAIGETIRGPNGAPWKVAGIVHKGDSATITAEPEQMPALIFGDDASYPLTS